MENIYQVVLALLASGGLLTILGLLIKAFFEKEVKKAIKLELQDVKKDIVDLKKDVADKQSKEICAINHNNIDRRLESIEDKLDRLIEMRGVNDIM